MTDCSTTKDQLKADKLEKMILDKQFELIILSAYGIGKHIKLIAMFKFIPNLFTPPIDYHLLVSTEKTRINDLPNILIHVEEYMKRKDEENMVIMRRFPIQTDDHLTFPLVYYRIRTHKGHFDSPNFEKAVEDFKKECEKLELLGFVE